MPLSTAPDTREKIHTRIVTCVGYRREDSLWDIEGHLLDTKGYDFTGDDNEQVPSGTPIHNMKIRMTVTEELEVTAIESCMDSSPFPETCPDINKRYQQIVGMKIGTGWTRSLREKFEGINGCTHMTELLGPMATTAYQAVIPYLARDRAQRARADNGEAPSPENTKRTMKPYAKALVNTCYAFREDGPIARRYLGEKAAPPDQPTTDEKEHS